MAAEKNAEGCDKDCPCRTPKLIDGKVHIFSTNELADYVEIARDDSGGRTFEVVKRERR